MTELSSDDAGAQHPGRHNSPVDLIGTIFLAVTVGGVFSMI